MNYCRAFHLTLTMLQHYLLELEITDTSDFNDVLHVRPNNHLVRYEATLTAQITIL